MTILAPWKGSTHDDIYLSICFFLKGFWNHSDTESEVDLQLSTGGNQVDDEVDDFDFYGWNHCNIISNVSPHWIIF